MRRHEYLGVDCREVRRDRGTSEDLDRVAVVSTVPEPFGWTFGVRSGRDAVCERGESGSYSSTDYGQYGGSLAGTPTPANPCGDPPGAVGTAVECADRGGGALRAQSPRRPNGEPVLLNGSVLRVDPATGAGVPGNQMYDAANPQSNASRIIVYGLRNPFRFTFAPGSSEMWIGDVGYKTWEEIDRLPTPPTTPTPNFGWPCYEGSGQQPEYSALGLDMCTVLYNYTAAAATAPWYTYSHVSTLSPADTCKTGTSATSGLAFVQAQSYPSAYACVRFFGDYSRNCIWVMTKGTNGNSSIRAPFERSSTTQTTHGPSISRPIRYRASSSTSTFSAPSTASPTRAPPSPR